LVLTDAWCLHARPKPHVVSARDAVWCLRTVPFEAALGNIVVARPPHGLVILDAKTGRVLGRRNATTRTPLYCPANKTTAACRCRRRFRCRVYGSGFKDDSDVPISSNGHFQYQSYITHIIIITTAISATYIGSARTHGALVGSGTLSSLVCQGPSGTGKVRNESWQVFLYTSVKRLVLVYQYFA